MLDSIFRHIDRLYGLELDVDIQDFLVSSDMCARLGQDGERAAVLVREGTSDGELELGVYIGDEALDKLAKIDLTTSICPDSFEVLDRTGTPELGKAIFALADIARAASTERWQEPRAATEAYRRAGR